MSADRAALARRVAALDPSLGEAMLRPGTSLRVLPAPLSEGALHEVSVRVGARPLLFSVGTAEPDFAVLLEDNPDGFAELAARARVRLDTPADREAYARAFLAATRPFDRAFAVLGDAADLAPRPGIDDASDARLAALKARYAPVIAPLSISEDAPWLARLFALRGRDLVRMELTLHPGGRVGVREAVLERALPVAYTL